MMLSSIVVCWHHVQNDFSHQALVFSEIACPDKVLHGLWVALGTPWGQKNHDCHDTVVDFVWTKPQKIMTLAVPLAFKPE